MTAAAAIWFDLLPPLRRTAGNVLFFVPWTTALAVGVAGFEAKSPVVREGWISDAGGLPVAGRDFLIGCARRRPASRRGWVRVQPVFPAPKGRHRAL
ncbi:MAG: hypothetical protein U1F19_00370 [Lysobacterales bacterium]